MPDILISENISGPQVDALQSTFEVTFAPDLWQSPAELQSTLARHRALIVRNQTPVTAELIAAATQLQVIGRAGIGLDNIDVRAASEAGIAVVYAPEQNAISVAELALGMMLSLARMLPAADRDTKAGGWARQRFTGIELYGKTLGLVGLGRIGYRTGLRARAFGMNIVAHDAYANPDGVFVSELQAPLLELDELLERSDFVSCHLPETPQTKGLFNYERFCHMKPAAYFINTSRGGVVAEDGLVRALQEHKIAGAALDVREQEPPPQSTLSAMDNVLLTPHIAAFTSEGQERVLACVCADVAAILRGEDAKNFVNFARPKR